MPWRGNRGVRLALAAASTLAGLALAEGLLRVYPTWFIYASMRNVVQRECTRPHPAIQYVNRENYAGEFANKEFRTTVRTNSKGLRDKEYPYERTPGRARCLLLGDSFVFGWGVEAEESVSKVLEARLTDVEFINAGCSGWSTKQEVLFFELEGVRYHPDVVLLFFCENDPYENPIEYSFVDGRLSYALAPRGPLHEAGRWLNRHSSAWNLLRQAAGAPVEDLGPVLPPEELWAGEEAYLGRLHKDCEDHGALLAVVYVPQKNRQGAPRHGGWFFPLRDLCSRGGLPLVDLVPAMSQADERERVFYRFDDHWNPHGHRVAARVLARFFSDEGWLDPPGPRGPGDRAERRAPQGVGLEPPGGAVPHRSDPAPATRHGGLGG